MFSGSLSPYILENFVKKAGLYVDTIVIPDPVFVISHIYKQITINRKYYLNKLVSHVFNIWKLRDILLTDSEQKILIVLPISLHILPTS